MHPFATGQAVGTFNIEENGTIVVSGKNTVFSGPQIISWIAAAPATAGESWAGSGLPHPNRAAAMETLLRGTLTSPDGTFTFRLAATPGSFYTGLGSHYVPPYVRIDFIAVSKDSKKTRTYIQLAEGIPFRVLTYPSRGRDVTFYAGRDLLPVRSGEEILRASAYPCDHKTPVNFWGGAVPHP